MNSTSVHSPANLLQNIEKRILVGVIAFAVAATVGTTSLVGAQPDDKPSKEWCKQQGYSNYGQCVKDWAHSHGYGGDDGKHHKHKHDKHPKHEKHPKHDKKDKHEKHEDKDKSD